MASASGSNQHPPLWTRLDSDLVSVITRCHNMFVSLILDKERILEILREHEPELKAAGLSHLRLFGSVARGDATPVSDIDLLFDSDEPESATLFAAYGFQDRVAEILGAPVHLSSSRYLRPQIRERVLREAIVAF